MSTSNTTIGLPLTNARRKDGSLVNSDFRNGSLKLVVAPSGSFLLQGETPQVAGYNVSDTVILPLVAPANFVPGNSALSISLRVALVSSMPNQSLSNANCALSVLRPNDDGSATAITVSTEPQALPAASQVAAPSYSQLTFDIDGSSINPGDELLVAVQIQVRENGPVHSYALISLAQLVAAVQNYQTA